MIRTMAFYVSGHGFGHSTRTQAVINEIPDAVRVFVSTSAPQWLYRENIRRDFEFREVECDVGVIQKDSLTIDEPASLKAWLEFEATLPDLIERETAFLRDEKVDLVLADIPAFPFEITKRLGIPGLALANFSWDWIYERYVHHLPGFAGPVRRLRESYGRCDLLLRLPFAGDLSAFPRIEDVPLVVLRTETSRKEARRALGIPDASALVSVSFGGFDFERFPWRELEWLRGRVAFASAHPKASPEIENFVSARNSGFGHQDLAAAADLVVSKPGYGIVSECISGRTPMLYTSRGDFAEYPILVRGIEERLPGSEFVSHDELLSPSIAGRIADALYRVAKTEIPVTPTNGAQIVADRLLSL